MDNGGSRARVGKRIVAGSAVAIVAAAGILLWQGHRESKAKAALAAEIRAEQASRERPPAPVPTAEERETAEQYRVAVSKLLVSDYLCDEIPGFHEAMDAVPWSAIPESVPAVLAANAEGLALADLADARGACRFADTALQKKMSSCGLLLTLLTARGHAALAGGNPFAAADEVGRLVRVGRDLATTPAVATEEESLDYSYLHLLGAERHAAGLLAALATTPDLPAEVGPALVAAALAPWGTAEANRRSVDFHEDATDAWALVILGPGAEAWLTRMNAQSAEWADLMKSGTPGFLERTGDRIRRVLRPGVSVPTAVEVREYRALQAPVVAAVRCRDMTALAPGGPHDKVGALFGFLGPKWFRLCLADEARVSIARAAAAIRAFQLREGRPPRALAELVPSVLPEVPLDPMDGAPLDYEVGEAGWRVTSRVWPEAWKHIDGTDRAYPNSEVRFPRAVK